MVRTATKHRRSIFITFLTSYIMILFFPTLVGIFSYCQSMQALRSKTEVYNMTMVEQAQQVIDERIHSIDQLVLDISLNPRIQRFIYRKSPASSSDIYSMKEVIDDIAKYRNTNPLVEQLFLYFQNSNVILINSGKHTSQYFYEEMSPYKDMGYEEWKQFINQNHHGRYLPQKTLTLTDKKVISCFQSLPFGDRNQTLATIGILVDTEYISNILNNIHMYSQGTIYMLNNEDEVMVREGTLKVPDYIPNLDLLSKQKQYYYDVIEDKKVLVTYINSKYNGWKYISIIPISAFTSDLDTLRNIVVGMMAIGVILGILTSYFLAKRNYMPIRRLVDNMQENLPDIPKRIKNEIVFIDEVTATTIRENKQIKEILSRQYPLIRTNLLMQLLKGTIAESSSMVEYFGAFQIKFKYPLFCVLIIHVDDSSQFTKCDSIEEYSLLKLAIVNIMEELANECNIAYTVDLDLNEMALIVNSDDDIIDWKTQIHDIAIKSREILNRQFSIFISIGIGTRYKGVFNISESYREAIQAIRYKMIKGKSSIIFYDEVNSGFGQNYYYPLDVEKRLKNSIKVGDKKSADKLLKEIIRRNFIKRNLPLEIARCLFFDIMGTTLKMLGEIGDDYSSIFGDKFDVIIKLTECSTIDEMLNIIDDIFYEICCHVNKNKKSHNDILKQKIIEFIDEHYMNSNIDLSMIAQAMDITPTYLSSFFKEQTGINILDYINKLRISKVKEILDHTSLNLSDIAANVGYTNSATLIRVFKKYEGITPGRYRKRFS